MLFAEISDVVVSGGIGTVVGTIVTLVGNQVIAWLKTRGAEGRADQETGVKVKEAEVKVEEARKENERKELVGMISHYEKFIDLQRLTIDQQGKAIADLQKQVWELKQEHTKEAVRTERYRNEIRHQRQILADHNIAYEPWDDDGDSSKTHTPLPFRG
jgi:hypothetical protein